MNGSEPKAGRTGICLNMIVRNETKVLDRLFRTIRDYIDYYVIVDTGSTDGTQDFIRSWMRQAGIEGEVYQRDWVNFGHNRQQALELAVEAGKGDWLLFIDADEELGVADPLFFSKLQAGVSYDIEKHHNNVRYAVPHLLDIRENRWQWKGVVHNYIQHLDGDNRRELLKDVWIIYHSGEGAKSHGLSDRQKFLRDARLLEVELKKNPADARSQFYLGQSYKHAGEPRKALDAYVKRAAMEAYAEEKYIAQLEVGRLSIQLNKHPRVILRELLKAYEFRPSRAEALHALAVYFREKQQYGRAWTFASVGAAMSKPLDLLFLEQDVYDWRLLDECAVAAYWTGRYSESLASGQKILQRIEKGLSIPPDHIRRIHQNIAFAQLKLDEL